MTQQGSSPLIQGAATLAAAEVQVEQAIKVDLPDVAAVLRQIALALPGFPGGRGVAPGPTPAPAPTPAPRPAPAPAPGASLTVVGSPRIS
jgi:hypothetical protein